MQPRIPMFGVDGETGKPAFEPLSFDAIDALGHDVAIVTERAPATRGRNEDIDDPDDLGQAGWAIIYTASVGDDVKDALRDLVELRRSQVLRGRRGAQLFREDLTIQPDDTLESLRVRWSFSPGPVDPAVVPVYLLIVGPPTDVSFDLQHDLDVGFFVGRLDLDGVEAYRAYAAAVVAAEQQPARPRRVVFWGPQHPDDEATQLSCANLVRPLAQEITKRGLAAVGCVTGDAATKAALAAQLHDPPAVMFTGGHGVYSRAGSPEQHALQGALVTREWPGPLDAKGFPVEQRFAASDLDDRPLGGLIVILFACFGAGVPTLSRYPYQPGEDRKVLADREFTAALPRALLARGAGAVLAHVDRTWNTGFSWEGIEQPQIQTWISVVQALLKGKRVGHAAERIAEKYAEIATRLSERLFAQATNGVVMSPAERRYAWLQHADTRGWIVLGDPAAKPALQAAP